MEIRHHLPDDLLLAYAAGSLAEGWSLAVASHLAYCPRCRQRDDALETIGTVVLEDMPPTAMGAGALEACMARAENAVAELPTGGSIASTAPAPLHRYLGCDPEAVKWKPLGGGIRQHIIATEDETRARLLYIPPGEDVPRHTHQGLELTLVLAGSFADGNEEFRIGDIEVADESVDHTPVSGKASPCICLAVTDAPLVFHSWLPRMIQRFAKI
ncbi:MAG: ChrR family anti-sigma-E factor [Alphaproteobacteria bacterium]